MNLKEEYTVEVRLFNSYWFSYTFCRVHVLKKENLWFQFIKHFQSPVKYQKAFFLVNKLQNPTFQTKLPYMYWKVVLRYVGWASLFFWTCNPFPQKAPTKIQILQRKSVVKVWMMSYECLWSDVNESVCKVYACVFTSNNSFMFLCFYISYHV